MPQRGRVEIGTFLDVVWIVGYAPLTVRTVNVMPIFFALAWTTGRIPLSAVRTSWTRRTPLHCFAVQTPPELAYFDSFISAFALAALPESPGVLYGWKPFSFPASIALGRMCWAISPAMAPPHAFLRPFLSITQFIARRTCTSSNGGWVRFIVM